MLRNIENWNDYLVYKYGGQKNPNFIFKVRNKFCVSVPRRIIPEFKESLFDEVYYKGLPKKIYKIKNPTVLDIGANVGFFTIFSIFKLDNPRIISFEPMKRNFEVLQKNVAAVKDCHLTIVNKAINDQKGELVLKFNSSQEITTSASLFDSQSGGDEEVVIATTLEEIFSAYNLSKVDILKLDCEGAEYNIFYNTPSHFFEKVNCITLETHKGKKENENNKALASYIQSLGFTVDTKQDDFIWAYKNPKQWI